MNILCSICARAGSKGVKNKNIKEIAGKPLIAWSIEQARESNLFNHIVISSDSDKIIELGKKYGAETFFKRDKFLSSDQAGKLDVIKDLLLKSEKFYNKKFDYIVDLDVTSPLRDTEDIIKAFSYFLETNSDNLITASLSRRSPYFNMVEVINGKVKLVKEGNFLRRQDVPKTYDMNASIYIWKREVLLNSKTLFLDKTALYVMPEERSIDIDSELDFRIVEMLLRDKNVKK